MNEFTENKCLPNFEPKFKPPSKPRENALTLTLKGFHSLRTGADIGFLREI